MAFDIEVGSRARKSLESLDARARKQINTKIESLRSWPSSHADTSKLKGRPNLWRLRVGDYRAIFSIDTRERKIYVRRIGHRRDIYLH